MLGNKNDNQTDFILATKFHSELNVQESVPLLSEGLKYQDLTSISFWFFLKESITFSINYFFDRLTIVFCFALFNINKDQKSIEAIGFAFTWGYFYFILFSLGTFKSQSGSCAGPSTVNETSTSIRSTSTDL